eukprot:gene11792-13012_t
MKVIAVLAFDSFLLSSKVLLAADKLDVTLGIDEAFLYFHNAALSNSNFTVYWRSDNCYDCLYRKLLSFSGEHRLNTTITAKIDTRWPVHIMIKATTGRFCKKSYQRQREFQLSQELGKPRNFLSSGNASTPSNVQEADQITVKPKSRLKSLDAFRGVAITVMIFVNYGGGRYYFFEHSLWNGLTVADVVFPWFIFIMGTSIDLSQRSLLSKGIRKQTVLKKIAIRSLKLFAIGLFLNNGKDLENWRIPGVLQRFGVSYFVVAVVSLYMSPSEETQDVRRRFDWTDQFRELWLFWTQWAAMFTLLIVYLLVTFFLHEKGCPRGYLGTGGIGENGAYPNCTGGAAGYLDRLVFGSHHMYNHPTCKKLYKTTLPYDPEGILGSLTSIFLTFLGLHAGRILFTHNSPSGRIVRWLICAVFWGAIAVALAGGTKNNGIIPINKNLWSPSFIFANASLAYLLLTFMYFVIDVKNWWGGGPFTFAGMNAIFLYCGHEVFHNFFPFNFVVDSPTHATALARSAVGVSVWMIVAYCLFVEKMFFKV